MIKLILVALLVCSSLAIDLKINNETMINQKPRLLNSTKNGQKMILGDLNDPQRNILYIANLKGTPYQMGVAYGELFKQQMKDLIQMFFNYFTDEVQKEMEKNHPKLPKFLFQKSRGVTKFSIEQALQLNVFITRKYTNPRYYQQIKGLAKGSGIPATQFQKVSIFPEYIKAACTVAGVWGPATLDNKTIHMRALDWDYKNPLNKYPIAVVYHPSNPKWHPHVNFAWVGFIGSLTGMSNKISVGQKVWLTPDGTVQTTRYGNPWIYVFRDILYDAHNLETAINILQTTHRTCTIHLGIASAQDKSFRMLDYSYKTLNIYDDKNYTHYGANHPKIAGVAYLDKHRQPSDDSQAGQVLTSNMYGYWEMQSLWRVLGFTHQTGDTQLAVFDLEDQEVLISYSQYNGTKKAFERNPIYLNMNQLFADF